MGWAVVGLARSSQLVAVDARPRALARGELGIQLARLRVLDRGRQRVVDLLVRVVGVVRGVFGRRPAADVVPLRGHLEAARKAPGSLS